VKTYATLPALKAATLAKCREDWRTHTGKEWIDEGREAARVALDEDLSDIPNAERALVGAFDAARDVVDQRPDDPRVAPLREFLSTLSDKTVTWIRHFRDLGKEGWNVAPPDGRTRLVLYELNAGRDDDPGRLARLSLLLGYFPRSPKMPARVASVVDLERKAFVRARVRARKWLADQKLMIVRRHGWVPAPSDALRGAGRTHRRPRDTPGRRAWGHRANSRRPLPSAPSADRGPRGGHRPQPDDGRGRRASEA